MSSSAAADVPRRRTARGRIADRHHRPRPEAAQPAAGVGSGRGSRQRISPSSGRRAEGARCRARLCRCEPRRGPSGSPAVEGRRRDQHDENEIRIATCAPSRVRDVRLRTAGCRRPRDQYARPAAGPGYTKQPESATLRDFGFRGGPQRLQRRLSLLRPRRVAALEVGIDRGIGEPGNAAHGDERGLRYRAGRASTPSRDVMARKLNDRRRAGALSTDGHCILPPAGPRSIAHALCAQPIGDRVAGSPPVTASKIDVPRSWMKEKLRTGQGVRRASAIRSARRQWWARNGFLPRRRVSGRYRILRPKATDRRERDGEPR